MVQKIRATLFRRRLMNKQVEVEEELKVLIQSITRVAFSVEM